MPHAMPHAPQLVPVESGTHWLPQQPCPLPHDVPQLPQFIVSLVTSTHLPAQQPLPAEQAWPALQPDMHW